MMKVVEFEPDHFAAELFRVEQCLKIALSNYKEGKSIKAICANLRAARRHINTAEGLIKVDAE